MPWEIITMRYYLLKNSFVVLIACIAFLSLATPALADFGVTIPNPLCLNGPGSPNCVSDFPSLLTKITGYIFTIIGALAVVMIVYAGFLFLISGGSPEKIGKAKSALVYAFWGIIIALAGTGLIAVIKAVLNVPS